MMTALVVLVAVGALGLAASAFVRARSLREALQDAQRRLYLAQARLNELESTVQQELQKLRTAVRRQAGGALFAPTMKIADAIAIDPRVREVLGQFHLGGCSSCAINEEHTIEQAATSYGVNLEHLMAALAALENGQAPKPPSSQHGRLLQLAEF
jgi:hybrid cluster-associated redox disulfide protein